MNEYKYFLDTNIFLRPIINDDSTKATDCRMLMQAIRYRHIVGRTSTLVLAEIAWTLQRFYKLDKLSVFEALAGVISIRHLRVDNAANAHIGVSLFKGCSVKFIDALIASHPAVRSGAMAVVSYDKDFDKLGVRRVEPAAVLKSIKRIHAK